MIDLCTGFGLIFSTIWKLVFQSPEEASRELFWNIPMAYQLIFYLIVGSTVVIFAIGVFDKILIWTKGSRNNGPSFTSLIKNLVLNGLGNKRLIEKDRFSWLMHFMILWGTIVLGLATLTVATNHYLIEQLFGEGILVGWNYLLFSGVVDVLGFLLVLGLIFALVRRLIIKPQRVEPSKEIFLLIITLLIISISGYVIEALRLYVQQPISALQLMDFSFIGAIISDFYSAINLNHEVALSLHFITWWIHVVLVMAILAYLPYSRLVHVVSAPLNMIYETGSSATLYKSLRPITDDKPAIEFTRNQLIALDACTRCGICDEVCPSYEAERYFTPRETIQALRNYTRDKYGLIAKLVKRTPSALFGDDAYIDGEKIWYCMSCRDCIQSCPVIIDVVGIITEMRSMLVEEGIIQKPLMDALSNTFQRGNPWGGIEDERTKWAEGLKVKLFKPNFQ